MPSGVYSRTEEHLKKLKGRKPWNKGLTKETDNRIKLYSIKTGLSHIGKKHTQEHKEKISESHKGNKHWNWKGGKIVSWAGYILIKSPEHNRADKSGYVREHIKVMEDYLKRPLKKGEVVHHINGNKADNRIENLIVLKDKRHKSNHAKEMWNKKI